MSEIKNRIITISGEARSGKSTLADELEKQLTALGFRVHRIEVGKQFREISEQEYLKMYPNKVNVTQAEIRADEAFSEKRKEIDKILDEIIRQKGIEINSEERPNDVYIIDSRLAWYNIPSSFAVYLMADKQVAGQRALKDKTKGSGDSYNDVVEATENTEQRTSNDVKTYEELYNVRLSNLENYDFVADTTYSNPSELAAIVIDGLNAYMKGEFYPKTWASPATFLTVQRNRTTFQESHDGYTVKDLAENIRQNGYDPVDGTLMIVEMDGVKFLVNGNHRVHAGLCAGKTLFPYEIIFKDGECPKEMQKILEGIPLEGMRRRFELEIQLVYDDQTLEHIYDWARAIAYCGGVEGKIEQFKDFEAKDLIPAQRSPILRTRLGIDRKTEDDGR